MGQHRATALVVGLALLALVLTAGCSGGEPSGDAATARCDWPMWGHDLSRTFTTPCASGIRPDTVARLEQRWFFNADDIVTTTPAVVDGTAYVGDWSGRFTALDTETGTPRWTFDAETAPSVYAGQITGSPAVATVGGVSVVFFGSGHTVYALATADGSVRWKARVGAAPRDGTPDLTEIETSPAVVGDQVLVGFDVHNQAGQRAGLTSFDAATGKVRWTFDGDQGGAATGCVDVWSSPAVDPGRNLAYVGTGNCPSSPTGWGKYTEAIVAVDLATGTPRWSYQPHPPNNDDLDFAGAPNLFEGGGRAVVGLGNKDGTYYAVDRDTGQLVWKAVATRPGLTKPGSNFSTGGFIGPAAVADGIVAGGTAVGPGPYLHGIDAATGAIRWQQTRAEATYGASASVNGVLFAGGNDFTLRALDLHTGDILWSTQLQGVMAGGTAITGDDIYVVAGIREPGTEKKPTTSGVYRFHLGSGGGSATTAPASGSIGTTGTTAPRATDIRLTNTPPQRCIGAPCPLPFTLKPVPAGLTPSGTLTIAPDPFSVTISTTGLGRPEQWLTPGSAATDTGARAFALYASESDDNPVGGLLCVLDDAGTCTTTSLPRMTTYNRITLLAVNDPSTLPPIAEGLARIVTTVSFDPLLQPVPAR